MRYRSDFIQVIAWLLLAVATQITTPEQAVAKDGLATQIPASAVVAICIADTKAFWAKASALPVTSALERLVNSPANANNLDFQEFQLQLQKLGAELGYEASFEEMLGNVFSHAKFYITPGLVGNAMGHLVFDLGIADKEKAAKLVSVIDKKNQEAQKIAAVGADAGSAPTFSFEKVDLAGQKISHYSSLTSGFDGQRKDGFYGIVGERFIFANAADAFTAAASGDGPALAGNADFSRLAGSLPLDKSDLVGWVDADAILKSGGMGAMLSQMPGLSASNKSAFTAQIGQNSILAKVISTADPAQGSDKINARPLQGLSYIGQQPLAAVVSGTLDSDLIYRQMAPMMSMMGGFGGSSPLDEVEASLGISIQNDVVPAIGNEMFFSLNNVGPNPANPFVPLVDFLLGCKVGDAAKMAQIMKKIELKIETQMAAVAIPQQPGQAAEGSKFQTSKVGDAEIRSMSLGFPGLNPGYSIFNDYLVVGLTAESIGQALQRAAGTMPDIKKGTQYGQLHNLAGTSDLYSFSSLDLARVAAIIQPYLPLMAQNMTPVQSQMLNQVVTDVLIHLGQITALETQENSLFAGYMTVEMR